MQVVNAHSVLDGVHAHLVGLTVDHATLDATTGQPDRKPGGVVVAAPGPLGRRRPSEFATPDHQCLLEQAAGLEIFE